MSEKYDAACKAWGRKKLRNAGIVCNEVTSVNYEVDHGGCCCCGDYCYCMKGDNVEVTIIYKVAGIAIKRHLSFTMELGTLLREVTEW